jgi:hypothetical protein
MNNEKHKVFTKKSTISFTPSPGRKPFINKFPLEDVEDFDDILSKQGLGKLSLTSKFTKNSIIKDNESLFKKMPNFLKNYEDLIDIIKIDSKEKLEKGIPEIFRKFETTTTISTVQEFIYNQEKKVIDHLSVEEEKIVQNLTNSEEIKDYYEFTEDCLKRIATMNIPAMNTIEHLRFDLPIKEINTKKLAIFDLDETLVHCEIKKPHKGKVQINIKLPNGELAKVIKNKIDRSKHKTILERMP